MSSPIVGRSSENVINGIMGDTAPSTSEYGSSMKVCFFFYHASRIMLCSCLSVPQVLLDRSKSPNSGFKPILPVDTQSVGHDALLMRLALSLRLY